MSQEFREIQYSLKTFEPDNMSLLAYLGGVDTQWTVFIPCRDTLRWWQCNVFGTIVNSRAAINNPRDPLPRGRFQMAVYRSITPLLPFGSVTNFAEMVPSTYYDSGVTYTPALYTKVNFAADTLAMGGSYWIVMRMEDETPSGSNVFQFNYQGWTINDTNLTYAILDDPTSSGALPATYSSTNIRVVLNNYPWARADYA